MGAAVGQRFLESVHLVNCHRNPDHPNPTVVLGVALARLRFGQHVAVGVVTRRGAADARILVLAVGKVSGRSAAGKALEHQIVAMIIVEGDIAAAL